MAQESDPRSADSSTFLIDEDTRGRRVVCFSPAFSSYLTFLSNSDVLDPWAIKKRQIWLSQVGPSQLLVYFERFPKSQQRATMRPVSRV